MTTAINYTTTGELATYLHDIGNDPSTGWNALAQLLIARVSRQIDTYTGRRFWTSTGDETYTFDGNGSYRFIPPLDIVSVTTLKVAVDTRAASSSTYTSIDALDWSLQPRVKRDGWPYQWIELSNSPVGDYSTGHSFTAFPPGYGTIQIVGKLGWDSTASTEVPDDIRHAAAALTAREWKAVGMNFSDVIGVEGMQVSTFSRGIPSDIRMILDAYRRRYVG